MDKAAILETSRRENRGADKMERYVLSYAGKLAA